MTALLPNGEIMDFLGIDWGSTNLRAWHVQQGIIVSKRELNKGIKNCTAEEYPILLQKLQDELSVKHLPTLICGMAGSAQGWQEAPYCDLSNIHKLHQYLQEVGGTNTAWLVPGVYYQDGNRYDVMRGEETQLLGILSKYPKFDGAVVMPGTHSKWVSINNSVVEKFTTYMTGELYALLRQHSLLAPMLKGEDCQQDFYAGIDAAKNQVNTVLTAQLFGIRAKSLLTSKKSMTSYLSGLLIGLEFLGYKGNRLLLLHDGQLGDRYKQAADYLGYTYSCIDAEDATIAGLILLANKYDLRQVK